MAHLQVHGVEPEIVDELRSRAAAQGVSVEEAHRRLLRAALVGEQEQPSRNFLEYLHSIPRREDIESHPVAPGEYVTDFQNMAAAAFQIADMPMPKAIEAIRNGIPTENFEAIARLLALTTEQLADKLGVSIRTIRDNHRKAERLSPENTEKLVRIARIHNQARIIFTDDASVSQWLSTPARALHGIAPIDLLDTEVGARWVEAVILGIAHGNFL